MNFFSKFTFLTLVLFNFNLFAASSTLNSVENLGYLKCGINGSLPGFSFQSGALEKGLDVDFCRAVSAAIFGSNAVNSVEYKRLNAKERFVALQSGEIDLLSRNTTWNATRDNSLGLEFIGVTFYDGQGFLTRKDIEQTSINEFEGASFCFVSGTTHQKNFSDYATKHNLTYDSVSYEDENSAFQAYLRGRCDVFTRDRSALAALKYKLGDSNEHIVLEDTISKEPLGPLVRENDPEWTNLVRWVYFALITAEEMGITSENIDSVYAETQDPSVMRFLGKKGKLSYQIGLENDWVVNVIKAVGNYGEIYERNISKIGLMREGSANALWNTLSGSRGLMYSPPFK